jgi:hypothetical protein
MQHCAITFSELEISLNSDLGEWATASHGMYESHQV